MATRHCTLEGTSVSSHASEDRIRQLQLLLETTLNNFERTRNNDYLRSAIRYAQDSVTMCPEDSPLRFSSLRLTSRAFLHRFQLLNELDDLEHALRWGKDAVQLRPQDDPERLVCLIEVTNALLVHFDLTESTEDLDEAICWSHELLLLCPEDDHETRVQVLWTLTKALRSTFAQTDDVDELDAIIHHYKELVSLCDDADPLCAPSYHHLAHACKTRYERSGNTNDLEDAVNFASCALIMHPEGHPHRVDCLDALGEVMLMQYKMSSEQSDVDIAIAMFEEALDLRSGSRGNTEDLKAVIKLAGALFVNWKDFGDLKSMTKTAIICRCALRDSPEGHTLRPLLISLLDTADAALRGQKSYKDDKGEGPSRIQQGNSAPTATTGGSSSFDEESVSQVAGFLHTQSPETLSPSQCQQLIDLFPPGDPGRPTALLGAGHILCQIVESTGDPDTITKAKNILQEALELHPSGHPNRLDCILHLIKALAKSYEVFGKKDDFEDSIRWEREAVELTPHEDPRWSIAFTNLASSLHERYRLSGDIADLEECERYTRELLEMCGSGNSRRPFVVWLGLNVATSYFSLTGSDQDLEKAIMSHAELIQITSEDDPRYAGSHHHLASAYLSRFRQSGDFQDLEHSIQLNETALLLRPKGHPDRATTLVNLADGMIAHYTWSSDVNVLERCISLREETLETLPDDHADMCDNILALSDALYMRFKRSSSLLDLQRVVDLRRMALALCAPGQSAYSRVLKDVAGTTVVLASETNDPSTIDDAIERYRELEELEGGANPSTFNLGHMTALLMRHKHSKRAEDLHVVIDTTRHSIDTRPLEDPDRHRAVAVLATALQVRWEQSLEPADLYASIRLHREALKLQPDSIPYIYCLANILLLAFLQFGDMLHLVESLGLHRCALYGTASDDSQYLKYLRDLIKALLALAEHTELPEALEESMKLLRILTDFIPEDPLVQNDANAKIAHTLVIRHRISGSAEDLDEAVHKYRGLLELPATSVPNRAALLHDTGGALATRYHRSHDLADLQESIRLYEELLSIPDAVETSGGQLVVSALRGLADGLWERFVALGDQDDSSRSFLSYEQALTMCCEGNAERLPSLVTFGVALHRRFELLGNIDDEEDSVRHHREAVQLCPKTHRHRATSVKYLAGALALRFHQTSEASDIDDAIDLLEESLAFYPEGRAGRASAQHDLATGLLARYNSGGATEDFERALELHLQAAQTSRTESGTESGPDHARNVIGLSDAYYSHFMQTEDPTELDACIDLRREALENLPSGHYSRPKELHNLGIFLAARASYTASLEDLEEALKLTEESLDGRGPDHADRSLFHQSLASLHLSHFRISGDQNRLDSAIASFTAAVTDNNRSARLRLGSAVEWLERVELCQPLTLARHQALLEAYEATIHLLPRVAYFGLDVGSRLQSLKESERLANDAAAHALVLGKPEVALELLEEGRAVFWTQVLRLRTPFDDLPPDIAEELKRISHQLDVESHQPRLSNTSASDEKRLLEEDVARRRRLSARFDALVEEVRGMKGFERFLLNQQYSHLTKAADKGPVVILLASRHACYAIVIKPSGSVHGVPLPSVTHDKLEKLGRAARGSSGIFRNVGIEDSEAPVERAGKRNASTNASPVLGYLWQKVVKPIVESLGLQRSQGRDRPRLWWCPTGPFSFLPIHAAGLHGATEGECCFDYVVSSYIPTLGALITARHRLKHHVRSDVQVLLVAEPGVPGTSTHLESAEEETQIVASVLEHRQVAYKTLVGGDLQTVVEQLEDAQFVHLSCHGQQDMSDPLQSGFILRDRKKLTIARLMQLQLGQAFFAFLGACETAKGDLSQPDQTMHLAATMLFAGYSSVIGTMWSMWDQDGPSVAKNVYEKLFESHDLDPDVIPYALDDAVSQLRAQNLPPERWATYIHIAI